MTIPLVLPLLGSGLRSNHQLQPANKVMKTVEVSKYTKIIEKERNFFSIQRLSRTCLYLRWKYDVLPHNFKIGKLPKRFVPLWHHLNCNLFVPFSSLQGLNFIKNGHLKLPIDYESPKVCDNLSVLSKTNVDNFVNIDVLSIFTNDSEGLVEGNKKIPSWILHLCDVERIESMLSHDFEWLLFQSKTIIDHAKNHNNNNGYILFDYIWNINLNGSNGIVPGVGNIFFSLSTAVLTAKETNRTLVLPPTHCLWDHGGSKHRNLYDGFKFYSNQINIIHWKTFVIENIHNNINNDNLIILQNMNDKVNLIWYNNDMNKNAKNNAYSFQTKHICTIYYQQHYDNMCNKEKYLIKKLPGTQLSSKKYLYINTPMEPYYVRFGGSQTHRKMSNIYHETVQLQKDVEFYAQKVIYNELNNNQVYDCVHIRRGDVLNDKRFPLSHLSLFDEARKSLYYLKNKKNINSIQMVPVYLSIEENMINESEIAMFRTILSPRKLIISFHSRKNTCNNEINDQSKNNCIHVGVFIDLAICRSSRIFIGSFLSSYTDIIFDMRLNLGKIENDDDIHFINGPPNNYDSKTSWYSWWN
jgi:hypothetical protein